MFRIIISADLIFFLSWHWIWRLNRSRKTQSLTPSHGRENSTSIQQLLADASPWMSHVIMIANDGLRNAILGFFFSGLEMCKNLPRLEKWLNWQWNHRSTITWRSLAAASNFFIFKCISKRCCFWPTTKKHILRARKAKQQQTRRVNEQNRNRFRSLGNRWEMFRVGLRGERKKPARG